MIAFNRKMEERQDLSHQAMLEQNPCMQDLSPRRQWSQDATGGQADQIVVNEEDLTKCFPCNASPSQDSLHLDRRTQEIRRHQLRLELAEYNLQSWGEPRRNSSDVVGLQESVGGIKSLLVWKFPYCLKTVMLGDGRLSCSLINSFCGKHRIQFSVDQL
jgi:hypothetical protein